MEIVSVILAVISVVFSFITYVKTFSYEKKKATIEYFNFLQNEVLDKFVCLNQDNAKTIVENLNNEQCKEAYNDYKVLIARLEHFAVGIKNRIYNYKIVDNIAGEHFIYLYIKIKPIIDKANKNELKAKHYRNFVELVKKLNRKYRIQIRE